MATKGRAARTASAASGCQIGGDEHTPLAAPWRGSQREGAKTSLYKYVRFEGDGVPLAKIVRDVFGADAVEMAGADYQLARRFFERWDMFKTDRRGGVLWVEPTLDVFHLSRQYADGKTRRRRQGGLSTVENWPNSGESRPADSPTPKYPKDRVRGLLAKRARLDGGDDGDRHDYRGEILRELATERENVADRYTILERVRGQGDDYLLLPYTTRHNDRGRALDVQQGFRGALDAAGERHNDAVVLTVTTDPGRHDSLSDALEALGDNKNRLLSWLATDSQLGRRPENLSVLEFTKAGLPHAHIVLFGVSWAAPQSAIAAKWSDLGQGEVVDVRTVHQRGEVWLMHNDDGGRVPLRHYLGKAIRELVQVASMDDDELRERVESGDIDLWRQALYWATERQYYSCSPSLKESNGDDGLPHVTVWRFRGVAKYQDIPAHVRRGAAVVGRGRPPPSESERVSR